MLKGPHRSVVTPTLKQVTPTLPSTQKLLCNAFQINLNTSVVAEIYSYSATLNDLDAGSQKVDDLRKVVQQLWSEMQLKFEDLFCFVGQVLFCLRKVPDFTLRTPDGSTLSLKFLAGHDHEAILQNPAAQRVYDYVVRKACSKLTFEKVGACRRYYSNSDLNDHGTYGKNPLSILKGFSQNIHWIAGQGPFLVLDVTLRPVLRKSLIQCIQTSLTDPDVIFSLDDEVVQNEWRRRCVEATVCAMHTNRIYKIKNVHFNMTPKSTFQLKYKDSNGQKKYRTITYQEHFENLMDRKIAEHNQPMLEAYAQKAHEKVFLIPELCALTGFTEELRKDRSLLTDAMKHGKISSDARFNSIMKMTGSISNVFRHVQEWGIHSLAQEPLEIPSRQLEHVEVDFGQKTFRVEDGQFQKWLRNGLQSPVFVDNWLFIFPETDHQVLDIWLQSLRDIGHVAFRIELQEPKRITVSDQKKDLSAILEAHVTPSTELVLLLTPQSESLRAYQTLKTFACTKHPIATQVVKSETIRKRQSIAAVLSRIVLQINAKLRGPLWHVNLKTQRTVSQTAPAGTFFDKATMVIGIDLQPVQDGYWMGCVASLDPHCAEFLSLPYHVKKKDLVAEKCKALQAFMHEALNIFLNKNQCLPMRILVYRGGSSHNLYPEIRQTEVEAFKYVLDNFAQGYKPLLTFVVCAKRVSLRFFLRKDEEPGITNPKSGCVVDQQITVAGVPNFYLINHSCTKGTSSPTHYLILLDENTNGHLDALQNLTYRLSFMYFNFAGSTKFPGPLMYAQKLASFSATAVRGAAPHHPDLKLFLYYL